MRVGVTFFNTHSSSEMRSSLVTSVDARCLLDSYRDRSWVRCLVCAGGLGGTNLGL